MSPRHSAIAQPYVIDTFTRSVSNAWGVADTGHAWGLINGSAGDYAVTGSKGSILLGASATKRMRLPTTFLRQDVDMLMRWQTNAVPTGAAIFVGFDPRYVDGTNHYRLSAAMLSTGPGTIQYKIEKVVANTLTTLVALTTIGGLTYAANTDFWIRVQALGVSPTTLNIKIWQDGTSEPGSWSGTTTDSASALQVRATAALRYVSNTITNVGGITGLFDDFKVKRAV